jgi:membrane-bound metal-dependent hydrolase YbcI (DUF457 family)
MPGFTTHISASATLGAGAALAGYSAGLPLTTCAVGAGLCTIGGMLPDLDGDTGVPVRETVHLVAAVVPVLMLGSLQAAGLDRESIVLALAGMYVLIRFGLGEWFKRVTVHRGMWHSIPAALNVGIIALLICSGEDILPRAFKAGAVVIGFLSHLVLDELASLDLFRLKVKESSGTALKLWTTKHWWPNVLTYGLLAVLLFSASRHPVIREGTTAWWARVNGDEGPSVGLEVQPLTPVKGASLRDVPTVPR